MWARRRCFWQGDLGVCSGRVSETVVGLVVRVHRVVWLALACCCLMVFRGSVTVVAVGVFVPGWYAMLGTPTVCLVGQCADVLVAGGSSRTGQGVAVWGGGAWG